MHEKELSKGISSLDSAESSPTNSKRTKGIWSIADVAAEASTSDEKDERSKEDLKLSPTEKSKQQATPPGATCKERALTCFLRLFHSCSQPGRCHVAVHLSSGRFSATNGCIDGGAYAFTFGCVFCSRFPFHIPLTSRRQSVHAISKAASNRRHRHAELLARIQHGNATTECSGNAGEKCR